MKRILTLLIIVLSVAHLSAQRNLAEARPVWFGVNMGGTWQTSDMKPVGGIGWGFTVARYSRISSPSPIYWGWRFRFLDGRNFGYNYHALYGVVNDPVLSTGTTNYSSGTDPDSGFIYSNYKMRLDEFAGEIIIGSNTLRKHGVLLYGWGGAGMTYWKTNTDQLDLGGGLYNYSSITDNGNETAVHAQLDAMWDRDYETNANGSVTGGQWGFMPSAGIGFGYQWSNFSICMEHKTTWALNDFIDGTNHTSFGAGTEHVNDIYHYDGLSVKWNFHHERETNNDVPPPPPMPDPTQYNQHQANEPLPTNDPIQHDPTVGNNDPNINNLPAANPPTVTFTTPNVEPYTATAINQNITVKVTGVNTKAQISLTINGVVSTDYNFNPATDQMTFSHTLNPGTNVYHVVATNSKGSAEDRQTIIYKQGDNTPQSTPPPTVNITSPATDPYTSTTATYTVVATTTNVAGAADVKVTRNGQPVTNFTFDPRTKIVSFVTTLSTGNNAYVITGTNNVGTATDAVTIVYGNANTVQPPVVTITYPSSCPFQTKTQNHTLSANVTNVTMASQCSVVFNGQTITNFQFTAHGQNATVSFPVVLVGGVNNFSVTGTNTAGTNTAACQITYKPQSTNTDPAPTVDIYNPNANPFSTTTAAQTINATVMNVTQQSQITVTKGNIGVPFTFNATTHVVTFNVTLSTGSNLYTVTATNTAGTASDNTTLILNTSQNGNVGGDPQNGGGSSRPGETTVGGTVGGGASSSGGGTSRPGETTVGGTVGGGASSAGGGSSRPGETTVGGGASPVGSGDRPDPNCVPPSIDLHIPSYSPVSTGTTSFNVVMIVNNCNSLSQITVKVNQVVMTSGINFNASTHQLSFTATLIGGQNGIQVIANNGCGTAQRGLVVNCSATNRQQQSSGGSPTPEPAKTETKKDEPKKDEPKPAPAPKPDPKPEPKPEPKPAPKDEPKKDEPKPAPAPAPAQGGTREGSSQPAPAPAAPSPRPR